MKSLQLLFLSLLLWVSIGCESDPCEDVECGTGYCIEGSCDCPEGFTGVNCEIELCYGIECINGNCDPQTENCNCNPNYYGESCNILCVNGEYANGECNCSEGYEGIACETEIRDRYIGYWDIDSWSSTTHIGGSPTPGFLPGVIQFHKGFNVSIVEFSSIHGAMLVNADNRLIGHVTGNSINFEFQNLIPQGTVYGSATLDDRVLSIQLYVFNPTTMLTQVSQGTFIKH